MATVTRSKVIQEGPAVTFSGLLAMQVCVPEAWGDAEVEGFANRENFAGTQNGWLIRKQGSEALGGADERVPCQERSGFVHVMLEC